MKLRALQRRASELGITDAALDDAEEKSEVIALIMAAAVYLNFKLPSAYRTHPVVLVGALLSMLVLFVFAGISGWGLATKLAGE